MFIVHGVIKATMNALLSHEALADEQSCTLKMILIIVIIIIIMTMCLATLKEITSDRQMNEQQNCHIMSRHVHDK